METEKSQGYICEKCNYISDIKKDYIKHLTTAKHKRKHLETDGNKKTPIALEVFTCEKCNKIYKNRIQRIILNIESIISRH